jgi:hypothetical protein
VIVAPSLDAEDEIKEFQIKHRMDYAVLSDAVDSMVGFGVTEGLPALYIVGKDGKIIWRGSKEEDEGFTVTLEKALAAP